MILNLFSARSDHPLADPKEVKRVIAALPLDNPAKAVDEIAGWLDSLRQADDIRVDQFFDVLRQLDDSVQHALRRLAKDYLHTPRLSKSEERRLWTINYAYWGDVAALYAQCLQRAAQNPKEKGSEAFRAHSPLASARLVAARATQLKWLEFRYGAVRDDLWLHLGRAYLAAEASGYAHKSLQLYPSHSALTSSAQQYLQAVVVHASSMDCLTPVEIELADRLLAHFLPGFVFSAEARPDGVYWIDAARPQPPARLAREPERMTDTLRFVAPGSVPKTLAEVMHRVERGDVPADLNLGGQYSAKALLPVLRHLAIQWAAQPPLREHQRHAVKTRIAVLHGFDDSFTVFAGEVARVGKERAAESWVVENVSLGGFGAGVEDIDGDWLKVGTLLSLQPEGGDNWVLGVVRRYGRESEASASVGIQSLARQAKSVELRPRVSGFAAAGAVPGIWLREGGAPGEVRLVLPLASFDLRESLEFTHEGRTHLLTPIELEESGSGFEIARYREHRVD